MSAGAHLHTLSRLFSVFPFLLFPATPHLHNLGLFVFLHNFDRTILLSNTDGGTRSVSNVPSLLLCLCISGLTWIPIRFRSNSIYISSEFIGIIALKCQVFIYLHFTQFNQFAHQLGLKRETWSGAHLHTRLRPTRTWLPTATHISVSTRLHILPLFFTAGRNKHCMQTRLIIPPTVARGLSTRSSPPTRISHWNMLINADLSRLNSLLIDANAGV